MNLCSDSDSYHNYEPGGKVLASVLLLIDLFSFATVRLLLEI